LFQTEEVIFVLSYKHIVYRHQESTEVLLLVLPNEADKDNKDLSVWPNRGQYK